MVSNLILLKNLNQKVNAGHEISPSKEKKSTYQIQETKSKSKSKGKGKNQSKFQH